MTMAYFSDRFGSGSQWAQAADCGSAMGHKVRELAAELTALGVIVSEP
ncbi:MAG: hypothetical protein ACFBSG_01735 [Leptolyngbyaceae cyanobacterium]